MFDSQDASQDTQDTQSRDDLSEERAPLFLRRGAFFASALGFLAIIVFYLQSVRFSYAPPQPSHTVVSPLLHFIGGAVFWGVVLDAIVADIIIACGFWRAHYNVWLIQSFLASLLITLLLGFLEVYYSKSIGGGYSEPMTWLWVSALQMLNTLCAYWDEPLDRIRVIEPLRNLVARLHKGHHAFWQAFYSIPTIPPTSLPAEASGADADATPATAVGDDPPKERR